MRGAKPPPKPMGELLILPSTNMRVPDPPRTLPEGLPQECWQDVVRELMLRNLYDSDCRDMVEAYCIQRARFIEANEEVHKHGLLIKMKGGSQRSNPYVSLSNQAYDRMVKLGAELGLTPVRRGRVKGAANTFQAPASKFLKSGV